MNRSKLRNYAPQARRDFIQAVTDRAAFYGVSAGKIEAITGTGDIVIIGGRAFPKSVATKRKALEERLNRDGFEQTIETLAYTWFNRFVAIRFMELHGYLNHGYRVLSNPDPTKTTPEILDHAEHIDLPGLNKENVIELKLDASKEPDLYRMLLIAQFNALHSAMPFLFERIDDETELVLPENLLHSDSILRKLVNDIDEFEWQEVEIMGWLYESYITELYEAVIGDVVESEDIPAATERFTPKWVVRYLVQNTLGRLWLSTYPESPLKGQMQYYIEAAEQNREVQGQLKAITPTGLSPEEITFLDPATGSGHILVEAYDLFKEIYRELGYRAKDIPRLILEKNLFGLEIDDRAAQLAAFALLMKARADDWRILESRVQPHVQAVAQTKGMDAVDIVAALNMASHKEAPPPPDQLFEMDDDLFTRAAADTAATGGISGVDVVALISLFEKAKTFGSLIQVTPVLAARLPHIEQQTKKVAARTDDVFSQTVARFLPVIEQAKMLAARYDCVVANPPYMGSKYYNRDLKEYIATHYQDAKADLYSCFMQRNCAFAKINGYVGMITIPNWMFLSSFETFRKTLLDHETIDTFIHNGRGVFGSDFGSCSFVFRNYSLPEYRGLFRRLFEKQGSVASNEVLESRFFETPDFLASPYDFRMIPGAVIAYWISDKERQAFANGVRLSEIAEPRQGLATADDDRFLRLWYEVSLTDFAFSATSRDKAALSNKKWFPFTKGGAFKRWYGNHEYVVDWERDGERIKAFRPRSVVRNESYYFRSGISWSLISISLPSFRYFPEGFVIGHKGPGIFTDQVSLFAVLAFLNSCVATKFLSVLSPAVGFEIGQIRDLPYVHGTAEVVAICRELVMIAQSDWDSFETSWDFESLPVLRHKVTTLQISQERDDDERRERFGRMKLLEEQINHFYIGACGLHGEIGETVPDEQITLDLPRRDEDMKRLISYSVGCMMGRYSLNSPGLIYAHHGNVGFDPALYHPFPADPNGMIPIMEGDWFAAAVANRFVDFVGVVWPKERLEENLVFIAEGLGQTKGEQPRDTIRRYVAAGFYKHHLQMYKRRPIYWLFSSGKERAFQCLVYLHRYHEGTLSRMRMEYVIPLQGKVAARIEQLASNILKSTSTSYRRTLDKERDTLIKQQAELQSYDEKLRHYADLRIKLDLDDGVKVNYGKFGDLVAEIDLKGKVAYVSSDFDHPTKEFHGDSK